MMTKQLDLTRVAISAVNIIAISKGITRIRGPCFLLVATLSSSLAEAS
jgi:hypothetical protein